jgi:hypothetical protein
MHLSYELPTLPAFQRHPSAVVRVATMTSHSAAAGAGADLSDDELRLRLHRWLWNQELTHQAASTRCGIAVARLSEIRLTPCTLTPDERQALTHLMRRP